MLMNYTYMTIIIILIISCIAIFLYHYNRKPQYKGRGYCDITAEYVMPQIYENFVTNDEINHLINSATPKFIDSTVLHPEGPSQDDGRKSKTAWLPKTDPVIYNIIKRVCDIVKIPVENAEEMQIVKYDPSGFYNEHFDSSCEDNKESVEFEKFGGQRPVTMIIYLNDDFTGGFTSFPKLKQEFQPKKGNALLFYSLQKHGNKGHPLSLHAGMPVLTGQKYIANIWLREKPYKNIIT
uniref:Fe2OG dioxygenase domain-containing protein n=1 Tax=viral metagenome TaxID=1070528 RepID=A0A6C0BYZ6_9ZZZZ